MRESMEATAALTNDITDQKDYMSLADAVANCQVKAKKTIIRWAKLDGIRERYGRTSTSNLERVVPVEWVRKKLEERQVPGEPIYEPVELIENVSFTRQETTSSLGPKVPALFQEQDAPQLLVFFDRLRQSQEAQALEVRKFIHESRVGHEIIGRALQEGREEGKKEIRRFQRFQGLVNLAVCLGVVLLGVGLGFVIQLGFELNSTRAEEAKSLRKDLGSKITSQEGALRDEIRGVKSSHRALQVSEERTTREMEQLQEGLQTLREDLIRREDALLDLFRSKEDELSSVKIRLESLVAENGELAGRLETAERPGSDSIQEE